MIKNIMKAKAWLFTLLIGMIGLVGFGNTTSDLAQNSEADTIVCCDTNVDSVSVVVPLDWKLKSTNVVQRSDGQFTVKVYQSKDCEYAICGNLEKYERTQGINLQTVLIPPNEKQMRHYNLSKENKSTDVASRIPRYGKRQYIPDII